MADFHAMARAGDGDGLEKALNIGDIAKSKVFVNTKDKLQRTPLHLAAFLGQLQAAEKLLEYGADVHAGAVDGFTPLHFAAQNGKFHMCKLLIKANSNIDRAVQKSARTALHLAASKGHESIMELLISKGADTEKVSRDGKTFIDCIADDAIRQHVERFLEERATRSKRQKVQVDEAS